MSTCLNNATVLGCYNGQTIAIHYVYDNAGQPKVIVTDVTGTPVAGANASNVVLGACKLEVNAGAEQIAGAAAPVVFAGLPQSWSSSTVPGKLHSITVSARGVTDGAALATAHQILLTAPSTLGAPMAMMDGETRTFSVERDIDSELLREYKVVAAGRAYANITYTFTV